MATTDYDYDRTSQTQQIIVQRRVVHAMFPNPDSAAQALGALLDQGVQANDVSVMIKDMPASWNTMTANNDVVDQATQGITVTTGKDAAAGAMKGTGIGLGLGALAALASIAIPGVGIVIGGGALAAALGATAATGVAGAMAGAVVGYLKDQGVDETMAHAVENDYELGGALLSVSTPSGEVSAEEIENTLAKYKDHWYGVKTTESDAIAANRANTTVAPPYTQ